MKKTRTRSIIVYFLVAGFFVGLGFFLFKLTVHAEDWAINPINAHLSGQELEGAGKILDRNKKVLAQSSDGKRLYNENEAVRRAVLHTIGDGSINITTSIQNQFSADLFGYNLITGLGAPKFLTMAKDIHLTLDSELCRIASEKLGSYKGAVCLYNYKTGEILCMVSKPTYDPYQIPDFSDETDDQYEGAYLNRVLSSSFTPGSVFKVVTSAAAIDCLPDLYEKEFYCPGNIEVGGETITCMEHHGTIDFEDGMAKSCNIVFAELAMELGKERMTMEAEKLGFNESFSIDGIPIQKSVYHVENATEADLGWSGIGQQNDLVNPAHLMKIMGAIANGGAPVEPYLISSMTSSFGINSHAGRTKVGDQMMSAGTANQLKEVMRYTTRSQYGDSMFPGLTVCSKTGTAEVGKGKNPHAWMTGFSTDEDCPLAFAIIVENSGYGYRQAGPIATAIMTAAAESIREK